MTEADGVAFRPAIFGDVLRSEWTKLRSVRSTFWALTVTAVLGIALGALISAAAAHGYSRLSVSGKLSWDPTNTSLSGMVVAQLAIAVLGVLCISSEYSSGMIRTSLIAVPKRGRLLAAKSLVFAVATLVVARSPASWRSSWARPSSAVMPPARRSVIPGSPGRWWERGCT
ncbi:MAG TPA: hypothetical protein VN847_03170 [Streptosporangiaceae bacterium]|nr:hypothetical protein [Streptosporangiaceae bacterium]